MSSPDPVVDVTCIQDEQAEPARSADCQERPPLGLDDVLIAPDPRKPAQSVAQAPSHPCQETAYVWDFTHDRLVWEHNAASMMGVGETVNIESGDAYRALIAPEHLHRQAAATRASPLEDHGKGVAYRIFYRLMPNGPRTSQITWVEDYGRWWAGPNGKPARARGVLRIHGETLPTTIKTADRDYNAVTGQLSRARLTDALTATIDRSAGSGAACGFLLIAMDGLDQVARIAGEDARDQLIQTVGQSLTRQLRGGDILGHYSATKFGVVFNNCDAAALQFAAARLRTTIEHTIEELGADLTAADVAMGGVILPEAADNVNAAMTATLRALETARQSRTATCVVYDPILGSARDSKVAKCAEGVRTALSDDRLELFLQPIVAAGTRDLKAYEALIRIKTTDGTILPASEFVENAEAVGLASAIDRRALEIGCNLLSMNSGLRLAINVSARTCSDPQWMEILKTGIETSPDLASRLLVEITETTSFEDLNVGAVFVDTLKDLGCRVAIDDFGTGFTSYATVKHLNVDVIKIDGTFIRNIVNDPIDQAFTKSIIDLARALKLDTVAEWVSDETTARYVEQLGVTALQGYHIGHPLAARDILANNVPLAGRRPIVAAGS